MTVNIVMDISSQHHALIVGHGGVSLQQMMQQSGASVQLPNPNVPDVQHRSSVYISGSMASVCSARQHLLVLLTVLVLIPFSMRRVVVNGNFRYLVS